MIGFDTTQVETLAEGWDFEADDVATAIDMADAIGLDAPTFVGTIDEIVTQINAHGGVRDERMHSASYIMYCFARLQAGLPLA